MTMTGSGGVVSGTTSRVAFSGTVVPTAISGSYRFGLLLVTVAMILVPLVYLLLIAAVAWFLVWHVTANTWILSGSGGSQWRFLGYVTPAIVAATLLFFMVKPILARRADRGDPVQVLEDEQPELHALIREICRQVRAPLPARVQVDCQVNASAALRGGVLGIFSRDLDLTIGLPLVTGLSVRQLSGVLAHEFGHFAQGGGMRMTALIRSVNAWLYRVVHERDTWDTQLEEWSKNGDWRLTLPLSLARLSIWISRQALNAVTMVGHGVSCYMLRQMEFDADSYEIKIAGSDAFARTFVRLRELSAGSQLAYRQLPQLLDKRAVPADMPRLVAECSRRLPDEIRKQVEKISEEKTGTFDTHPSDADRVAASRALAASGALVGGDEPATNLFRDFENLSVTVTRHHYESDLGIELGNVRLLADDEALHGAEEHQRMEAAMHDMFASRVSISRPLRIAVDEAAVGAVNTEETLAQVRTAVKESTLSEESYRRFEQFEFRHALAFSAEQLLLAGVPGVDAKQFQIAEPTLAGAQSTRKWALQQQDALRAYLDRFDALVARRIGLGVLILERTGRDAEARALALAVTALADAIPFVTEARQSLMAAAILDEVTPALETSTHLRERTGGLTATAERCRLRACDVLGKAPMPAGELHDKWQRLLVEGKTLPHGDFLERLTDLYWACLSRLVRLVADAEVPAVRA